MTAPLIVAMPGNEAMTRTLAQALAADVGRSSCTYFPTAKPICGSSLAFPDERSSSYARSIGRMTRYCRCCLRRRRRASSAQLPSAWSRPTSPICGKTGDSSRARPRRREVARLLSDAFDWLVTVDPHLHRYRSLAEIYCIPTRVVHAAPLVSQWIRAHVIKPFVIGPDSESEQWVSAVARQADAPYTVLGKVRRGDRDIEISVKNLRDLEERTPVLVDDIISSGRTMIEAVRLIVKQGAAPPICIAVHGLFADRCDALLAQAGARVVTSNSIPHETNGFDVAPLLADAVRAQLPPAISPPEP